MRRNQIETLCCPACYARLGLRDAQEKNGIVLNGLLVCGACGREFPIIEGVTFLSVLDSNWGVILRELIARREITWRGILKAPVEQDRLEKKERQEAVVKDLMSDLFDQAVRRIEFGGRPRILDVGAGECKTSTVLAERGAEVTVTETEVSNLKFLNFADLFDAPPPRVIINGHVFHRRNPEVARAYFSPVVCDSQRLPFADGFFDVALCRSVLHHIERPGRTVREMLRVVRPGGQVVFISEPIRSILDPEGEYIDDGFDKQEGLNEQAPTLLHYLLPALRKAEGIEAQYWHWPLRSRTKRFFDLLHYNYPKHFRAGETTGGWRLAKLLFTGAAVNLFLRRGRASIAKPRRIRPREEFGSIRQVADTYYNHATEGSLKGFRADTDRLKALRLAIMNGTMSAPPSRLFVARCSPKLLEAGWRDPVVSAKGAFRFTMGRATLRVGSPGRGALVLRMVLGRGDLEDAPRGRIVVDTSPVGQFRCQEPGWQAFEFPLENPSRRRVHLVEIENEGFSKRRGENDPSRVYGVAVKSVGIFRA